MKIRVRGIQHFTNRGRSKNSADLAITADAIAAFALGCTDLVAVVSNDSDFGALFIKVREISAARAYESVQFLWIVSEGGGALSPEVNRFVPDDNRWELSTGDDGGSKPSPMNEGKIGSNNDGVVSKVSASPVKLTLNAQITHTIVRHMPLGAFRSSDAHRVVTRHMSHSSIPNNHVQFAKLLFEEVSKDLEDLGVRVNRTQKSSKRYTITEQSKNAI